MGVTPRPRLTEEEDEEDDQEVAHINRDLHDGVDQDAGGLEPPEVAQQAEPRGESRQAPGNRRRVAERITHPELDGGEDGGEGEEVQDVPHMGEIVDWPLGQPRQQVGRDGAQLLQVKVAAMRPEGNAGQEREADEEEGRADQRAAEPGER
jgi:hypothetical protein